MGYTRHYRVGYTQQHKDEHAAMLQRQAEEAEAQKQCNAASRAAYLAGLEAKREEERKAFDARLEEELTPERERLKREWMANNPGYSEADFLNIAWPLLRQNIVEASNREHFEAAKESLRSSGLYSF